MRLIFFISSRVGREAHDAHERCAGDANSGQVGRCRRHVLDRPLHEERFGELVAQEAEPGNLGRVAVRLGAHLENVDDEQVAGLGALHVDRAGERVEEVQVDVADLDRGGAGVELAVERVTRLDQDLVAGFAGDDWRDVGMPAVVPERGLGSQRHRAIDPDLVLRHGFLRRVVMLRTVAPRTDRRAREDPW